MADAVLSGSVNNVLGTLGNKSIHFLRKEPLYVTLMQHFHMVYAKRNIVQNVLEKHACNLSSLDSGRNKGTITFHLYFAQKYIKSF